MNKVDRFIALTEFSRNKFIEAGFPDKKIAVKPNFVFPPPAANKTKRHGALFAGRLSSEKGIDILIEAWKELDVPLRIAGDGPLAPMLRGCASPHITLLGKLSRNELAIEMSNSKFLIMPSTCSEGLPMVAIEAFACGTAVIASKLGGLAEIVANEVTGLHFNPEYPKDLVAKVRWAIKHPKQIAEFGRNAHRVYEKQYTPEANYPQLMAIYEEAIHQRKEIQHSNPSNRPSEKRQNFEPTG